MIRRLICFLATMIVLLTAAQVPVFAGSEASAAGTIVSRDEYETPLMKDGAQSIQDSAVTGIEDKTYTGEALTQSPVVVLNKVTLKEGTDYELTYGNNINAGTATVTINGIGRYQSSISRTFTINKAVNPMTVKAKKLTAKSSGKTTFKKKEAFTVKNAQGKVTYKKVKGNSKIRVYKSGKVIVKKGLETGRTYSVKVKVTAAGNTNYKEKSKKVTLKIKID